MQQEITRCIPGYPSTLPVSSRGQRHTSNRGQERASIYFHTVSFVFSRQSHDARAVAFRNASSDQRKSRRSIKVYTNPSTPLGRPSFVAA